MECLWNCCNLVKKPFHIRSNPPKEVFLHELHFSVPFLLFFVCAWCFGWFFTGVLSFLPFGRVLDPVFPFFVGSVGFDCFFFQILSCCFCHSVGFWRLPTIAHDCPRLPTIAPRLPTIAHDCPTIFHDCPRLPTIAPRLPTIAPRLPTIAHDCPTVAHNCPKRQKFPKTAKSAKHQRKTLKKKRQTWQKRKKGAQKTTNPKQQKATRRLKNDQNQTLTKTTKWAFKIATNSCEKRCFEAKIARVSKGLRLFGSFLRSRSTNTTESNFSLPLTTDWSSKRFYCLRCENWQHAEDERRERSQSIPKIFWWETSAQA